MNRPRPRRSAAEGLLDLESLNSPGRPGLSVVPASAWPAMPLVGPSQPIELGPSAQLATSQRSVHAEVVDERLASGDYGELSVSEVAPARFLLWDGHHALAARLLAGAPLVGHAYLPQSRGDRIAAPRLRPRRGA